MSSLEECCLCRTRCFCVWSPK